MTEEKIPPARAAKSKLYPPRRGARKLQIFVQALSLLLFVCLLALAAFPLPAHWGTQGGGALLPLNIFLRLDPMVAVGTEIAARAFIPALLPGLVLLGLALLAGRFFCGYVCPMGSSLDLASAVLRRFLPAPPQGHFSPAKEKTLPRVRFVVLAFLLGAAFLGSNIFFLLSPIPLVTALYALFLHPLLLLLGKWGLALAQHMPDPTLWGLTPDLTLVELKIRSYASLWVFSCLWLLILLLEYVRPRFWCRYVCPAGALLSLCSLRPLWRRRVWHCIDCGQCQRHCPATNSDKVTIQQSNSIVPVAHTGAINPANPRCSDQSQCLVCRCCVDVCPTKGTTFAFRANIPASSTTPAAQEAKNPHAAKDRQNVACEQGQAALPSRRAFLLGAGAGAGLVFLPGLAPQAPHALPPTLIRPPGSLPERTFLALCVRCGLCMKACPSHALHPLWLGGGLPALSSPVLLAQRGPCEPDCHMCGQLCPSGAIAPLSLAEKAWAKMGTALVLREKCVAWHEDKRCMVCQEVCPFGAIDLVRPEGKGSSSPPVPVVREERCYGCGYCEYHCPVRSKAIVIESKGALRLPASTAQSYAETAHKQGLDLLRGRHGTVEEENLPEGALPPGFTD